MKSSLKIKTIKKSYAIRLEWGGCKLIKSHQRFLNTLFILIDMITISFSLFFAWFVRFRSGIFSLQDGFLDFYAYVYPLIFILPLYLLIYNAFGLYQPYRLKGLGYEVANLFKANIVGIFLFLSYLFLFKQVDYSRLVLALFGILAIVFSIFERASLRLILRKMRSNGYNLKHILIVGASDSAHNFVSKINKHKYLGYSIIGFLDDDFKLGHKINGAEVLGTIDELNNILQIHQLDEVIIAISIKHYDRLNDIIKVCEKYGVKAQIIPDYYKYLPAKPYVDQIEDLPIINIRYVPLDEAFNKLTKRTMDILISLVGILVTSPILIITTFIIKLTSPGPILFKQTRVGLNRHNFEMYKFRSMKIQTEEESDTVWTTKNDPRKTKFGDFIRKTSIDELPQLLNVLKGDMSIIGPRPERPFFVDKFKEEIPKYMVKHHVRPGITGWAQVNGFRGDTSIKGRVEHDIYYIENWTLMLDIKIIFMTFLKGFVNKNAY